MLFANNCNTTLNGSISAIATSMVVTSATGFPVPTGAQYFYCTLADAATQTTIEIVKVTVVSGTTFTIVRGQDGTTGTIFASGAVVSLRLVRASLNDFPKLDEDNTFSGAITFSTPLVATNMVQSSTSSNGYLSSTDWTTFNSKQPALVSGTNIKTVGGVSLLGSGDVGTINVAHGGTGLTSLTANYVPYGNGTSAFNSSANLQFDGTNLSLGGAASAWSNAQAVQLGTGSLAVYGNNPQTWLSSNSYYNGSSWIYSTTAPSVYYAMQGISGAHAWFVAPSGTAGAAITYTQAMTLHNSGGVSIGNTTDPGATNLSVTGKITTGNATAWAGTASISSQSGYACKAGQTGAFSGNGFNINWTGSAAQLWIDTVNLGTITTVSDYRIKQDVQDMVSTALSRVKLLRPITYTLSSIGPFKADGVIRESFIAHELQVIIPSSVNGEKDAVDEEGNIQPQTVNLAPIVSLLTKALQELNNKFDAYVASHP